MCQPRMGLLTPCVCVDHTPFRRICACLDGRVVTAAVARTHARGLLVLVCIVVHRNNGREQWRCFEIATPYHMCVAGTEQQAHKQSRAVMLR